MPGLIDLHNHLAYNTLPLWTEPKQTTPFLHHNSWTRAPTYSASTTWPAYALITACPAELLAYVETKAIVGGTTTIQGSPPMNRPRDGWLVRNVEDETFGTGDDDRIYASDADRQARRAGRPGRNGCARARPSSTTAPRGSRAASWPGSSWTPSGPGACRRASSRCTPTPPTRPGSRPGGRRPAPSPGRRSRTSGSTARPPTCLRRNGSGSPSASARTGRRRAPSTSSARSRSARLVSDHLGWGLTDEQLVAMMTVLAGRRAGPGLAPPARTAAAQGDRRRPGAQRPAPAPTRTPRSSAATERDVELVVVAGQARYGTPALMAAGDRPAGHHDHRCGTGPFAPADAAPDDTAAGLAVVRRRGPDGAGPRGPQGGDREGAEPGSRASPAGSTDHDAPLRLALDMPTGLGPVGGLPKDLDDVHVPPLQSLTHDADWLNVVGGQAVSTAACWTAWPGTTRHEEADDGEQARRHERRTSTPRAGAARWARRWRRRAGRRPARRRRAPGGAGHPDRGAGRRLRAPAGQAGGVRDRPGARAGAAAPQGLRPQRRRVPPRGHRRSSPGCATRTPGTSGRAACAARWRRCRSWSSSTARTTTRSTWSPRPPAWSRGSRTFEAGVRLEWWNGIPFARAVEVYADRETGGRPDSRRARALET